MILTAIDYFFIVFASIAMFSYLGLGLVSWKAIKKYDRDNSPIDFEMLKMSSLAPKVSLIAPAHNEGVTIIENVKSMLALQYPSLDIIIVNDGSTDDTIEKLKLTYRLKKIDLKTTGEIKTERVKAVYHSEIIHSHRLIVVDKENGGKADALNAGINIANTNLVACIDVDCVLEPDAILKMVKPFLMDKKVIATGGVIRISNASKVKSGKLVKARIPNRLIEKFQFLEYLRAFLIGRMGWSKMNGLLIISGAFGLLRRDLVVKCGGYMRGTVGEDMELIVRMRKWMHQNDQEYRMEYIPEPLCWTEVPGNLKILGRQRNRWTRGLIDTLILHKDMALNKKYGLIGMLSYPYWLLLEWLAPILEVLGLIYMVFLFWNDRLDWMYSGSLLLLVYAFAVMISFFALLLDEQTTFQYSDPNDLKHLVLTALLEPLLYHPLIIFWAIRGNIDYWRGNRSWGAMQRQGFSGS